MRASILSIVQSIASAIASAIAPAVAPAVRGLGLGLGLVGLAGGCTVTPDPCMGYEQACLAVTVERGPADTYQLLVAVQDGYGSITPVTPRKQPQKPLPYPLRFAIRFGEFDPFHKGTVTFTVEALNRADDVIGYLRQPVAIEGFQHERIAVSLGAPADLSPTDLAEADFSRPDGGGGPTDLHTTPDMP